MNRIFDLRFVIGIFFLVTGILLLVHSFLATSSADVQTINRWCGIVFSVFGVLMILLSLKKEAGEEVESPPDGRQG